MPAYLRKEWREGRWRRVIRFRMNNEMRGTRYWETEEKRMCKLCGRRHGNICWGNLWGERRMGESLREILGQEGEKERWLKELEEKREKEEGG